MGEDQTMSNCTHTQSYTRTILSLGTTTYKQMVTFYGSQFIDNRLPVEGTEVTISGLDDPAVVNSDGMYIFGGDGKKVSTQ